MAVVDCGRVLIGYNPPKTPPQHHSVVDCGRVLIGYNKKETTMNPTMLWIADGF